jgi:hypothetical protein
MNRGVKNKDFSLKKYNRYVFIEYGNDSLKRRRRFFVNQITNGRQIFKYSYSRMRPAPFEPLHAVASAPLKRTAVRQADGGVFVAGENPRPSIDGYLRRLSGGAD